MRASQINGCAYCLDMHSKDARAAGETEQRLYMLDAWREAPLYSERERAALEWTEAVTRVADTTFRPTCTPTVSERFTEQELVSLTLAVVAINGWNRLNIAFRTEARQLSSRHVQESGEDGIAATLTPGRAQAAGRWRAALGRAMARSPRCAMARGRSLRHGARPCVARWRVAVRCAMARPCVARWRLALRCATERLARHCARARRPCDRYGRIAPRQARE